MMKEVSIGVITSVLTAAFLWGSGVISRLPSYITIPEGGVVAFDLQSCPIGWDEYKPAHGRFIRGIDRSGNHIDPYSERVHGNIQEDEFKEHNHFGGDHFHNVPANLGTIGPRGPKSGSAHGFPKSTNSGDIIKPEGGKETRPKNVALLFCEKR